VIPWLHIALDVSLIKVIADVYLISFSLLNQFQVRSGEYGLSKLLLLVEHMFINNVQSPLRLL
jgi:hypothetical protein